MAESQWGPPVFRWQGSADDQVYEHQVVGTSSTLLITQNGDEPKRDAAVESSDLNFVNGLVVWESAIDLVRLIEARVASGALQMRGKRVLELGAGTGLVGLCCASLGADVTLTDIDPPVLQLLDYNVRQNEAAMDGTARAMEWDWGKPIDVPRRQLFDVVVATDVLASETNALLVARALGNVVTEGCQVLLANEALWSYHDEFLAEAAAQGLVVTCAEEEAPLSGTRLLELKLLDETNTAAEDSHHTNTAAEDDAPAAAASTLWLQQLCENAAAEDIQVKWNTRAVNANYRTDITFGDRIIKGPPRLTERDAENAASKIALEKSHPVTASRPADYMYTTHDIIVQPKSSSHKYTLVLLHGLDDSACYWVDLEPDLHSVLATCGVPQHNLRLVCVNAPYVASDGAAWFAYHTDKSGQDCEDEIDNCQLQESRRHLHKLLEHEVALVGGMAERVMIGGSSQGGCMALDAALTYPRALGGVVCLRGLLLGATPLDRVPHELPVMVVSGGNDQVFKLSLVKRTLERLGGSSVDLQHHVIKRMTHDSDCVPELEKLVLFVAKYFHMSE